MISSFARVLAASSLVAGVLAVGPLAAGAASPVPSATSSSARGTTASPVRVSQVSPFDPADHQRIFIERLAPAHAKAKGKWRLNVDMILSNTASEPVTLSSVAVSFPGTTIKTRSYPVDRVIPAQGDDGSSFLYVVPEDRLFSLPVVRRMRLELDFDGYAPTTIDRTLTRYVDHTASGGYRFPSRPLKGNVWTLNTGHEAGSHHRGVQNQRFAYDLVVIHWTGSAWTFNKPGTDGTKNSDSLSWNVPIYAMADGYVRACSADSPNNPRPGVIAPDQPAEGNHLYIAHGTKEVALYAHFKAGSIPKRLCPKTSTGPLNIRVKQGELLGRMGNSGNSSGPHLHLHLASYQNYWTPQGKPAEGLPLLFNHVTVRTLDTYYDHGVRPGGTYLGDRQSSALVGGSIIDPAR